MKKTVAAKKFVHIGKAKSVIASRFRVKSDHGIFAVPSKKGATVSIKKFCDSYGVDKDAFSRMTGFSPRAVANWSSGKPPGPSAQKKFTELTRLFDALCDLVVPKAIGPWLKTSNPAFDGSTPLQVIERGETDRLWRMIWQLESGNSG